VAPRRILARADFPNGAVGLGEDTLMPRPLRWELGPFLEYVNRMADRNFLREYVQYVQQTGDPIIRAAYEKHFR
jgi:hypothetical protein